MEALEARVEALEAQQEAPDEPADRAAHREELRERLEARRLARRSGTPATTGKERLLDQDALARSGRVIPHKGPAGEVNGFRISAIRRGSPPEQLGLMNGDIVHAVEGHSLTTVDDAMAAYEAVTDADQNTVDLTRPGGADGGGPRSHRPLRGGRARRGRRGALPRRLARRPRGPLQDGGALIHRGPDREFDGYRLSGIRRGIPPDQLGLMNGDIVHAIDDHPLTSVEAAMSAYNELRDKDSVEVDLTRRGERALLRIDLW